MVIATFYGRLDGRLAASVVTGDGDGSGGNINGGDSVGRACRGAKPGIRPLGICPLLMRPAGFLRPGFAARYSAARRTTRPFI